MAKVDDLQLVEKCLAGDSSAFGKLLATYQKAIFNLALRMTGSYEDAQDITQAVFIKAYEKLESYNPEFKFFSWIYRMAVNSSINFLKQKRQTVALSEMMVATEKNPEEQYLITETNREVLDSLMELSIDYRVAIILRHFGGFSYQEMSYILNIPEKTVKSRLFSARMNLRQILSKHGIDHGG